jgi:hypothetical protein
MTAANDIRAEVERIAAHAAVSMQAVHMGIKQKALGGDSPMDHWSVCFTKRYGDGDEVSEDFDFFTGLGHREKPQWKHGVTGYGNGPEPRPGSLLYEQWEKQAKPQAPHIADVLHSIILDSSAAGQSFESWCDEFGYDTDSRKAEDIYRACQENADKLARIFNANDREALTQALQDY